MGPIAWLSIRKQITRDRATAKRLKEEQIAKKEREHVLLLEAVRMAEEWFQSGHKVPRA